MSKTVRAMTAMTAGTLVALLAGCGSNTITVSGSLRDPMITGAGLCSGNGTQQIALTNAAGTVIARDNAKFTWQRGTCVLPFSFPDVPHLAGYGLRVPGGNGSTDWLTPAQAARPIHRSEMPLI